jgi:hypothetical protein
VAGTVCWLLGLEEFVGQGIAQAAWTTPYSLSQDYISDLGVTRCGTYRILGETSYICSPLHDVMNVSFVLAGLFMVAGVLLLRGIWPRRPLATAGLVLIALAGVGRAPTAYYYATECRYEQPARQRFRPAADGGATSGSGWPTAECLRRRQPGGM